MKKFKKAASCVISAAVAFSSAGAAVSAERFAWDESIVSEAFASVKKLTVGETKTYTVKMPYSKLGDIKVYITGSDAVKLVSKSGNKKKVNIKLEAVSEGTCKIRVYNKKTKKSCTFKVKVSASETSDTETVNVIVRFDGEKVYYYVENSNSENEKDTKTKTDDTDSADTAAEQVLELVNKEREAAGVEPMTLDKELCAAAQIRAEEIASVFSHDRPDGSSCFSVLDGYSGQTWIRGENIAMGQRNSEEVMNSWMNSPGHKSNILNSDFTKLGVGYDSSHNTWVQIFVG